MMSSKICLFELYKNVLNTKETPIELLIATCLTHIYFLYHILFLISHIYIHSYSWRLNNKRQTSWQDTGSLKIDHVTTNYTGQYQCFAKNQYGIASSNVVTVTVRQNGHNYDNTPHLVWNI